MRNLKLAACLFTLVVGSPAGALEWVHIKVADATTVVPGGDGGTFGGINRVGLEDGVAYFTGGGGGVAGIYAANYLEPEGLVALYDSSTPVPGGTSTFNLGEWGQHDPIMDHESVVFIARASSGDRDRGVYTDAWGPLAVVADENTRVPGTTEDFTGFRSPWLCDGNVVFFGFGSGGWGVYHHDGTALRVVADLSTPVPGGSGNFTGFRVSSKPFFENGKVLFRAYGDGQEGVYLEEGGVFTVIADRNTPIPGGEGNFVELRSGMQLIHPDGWIIFSNQGFPDQDPATPDADAGVYAYDSGKLSVVVDKNTPVSGTTDTLLRFRDGGIHSRREISIFGDFTAVNDANIYSTLGGDGVQPVFSIGDVVGGEEVAGFGSYSWSVDGNAIASQTFLIGEGGKAAFVSVPVASTVPLMAPPWMHLGLATLLVTVGLSSLATRRRS